VRKVFGIITNCPVCHNDMLVPLNNARLHLVSAQLEDPFQLQLEASPEVGEGAESEAEMSQAEAKEGQIQQAQRPFSVTQYDHLIH